MPYDFDKLLVLYDSDKMFKGMNSILLLLTVLINHLNTHDLFIRNSLIEDFLKECEIPLFIAIVYRKVSLNFVLTLYISSVVPLLFGNL